MIPVLERTEPRALDAAIVATIAYADVFDYPLTLTELHRYLIGAAASRSSVEAVVADHPAIDRAGDYLVLPGRSAIGATRRRRNVIAAARWPRALGYGRRIAALPFVRMVGVTGALAVNNIEDDGDIDYLVVSEAARLWLCRLLVIALVRLARLRGDEVCPNYFVSERALAFDDQSLFAAHELAQMVPISGRRIYDAMRVANGWTADYLPNAGGPPRTVRSAEVRPSATVERLLRGGVGERIEQWEMDRKLAKYRRRPAAETAFGPDWCKGHFDGHGQATIAAYEARLRALGMA